MGYKLAGYDHLGGVEIDPRMAAVYSKNHKPKMLYEEDLRLFNQRTDLPDVLYNLDLLDGSPPCSTFSTSGLREKAWGKEKQFREGQALQVLDDLVFVYADTILKLKPKVFILENVSGLLKGNAKAYVASVLRKLSPAYRVQIFLLNAASMGLPQRRERAFLIGLRNDIDLPPLVLQFNSRVVPYSEIEDADMGHGVWPSDAPYLPYVKEGGTVKSVHPKGNQFSSIKLHRNKPVNTITAGSKLYHYELPKRLSDRELCLAGSYPLDYDFNGNAVQYLVGMSVPPLMAASIGCEIYKQWLSKSA